MSHSGVHAVWHFVQPIRSRLDFYLFWICRVCQWFFELALKLMPEWNFKIFEISNDFWRVKPSYKWLLIIGDVYCCHIFVMRRCKLCSKLIFFQFLKFFFERKFRFWDFFELLNGLIRNRKRGRIIVNQIEFSITTFINLFNPHFKKWYFRNCIFL